MIFKIHNFINNVPRFPRNTFIYLLNCCGDTCLIYLQCHGQKIDAIYSHKYLKNIRYMDLQHKEHLSLYSEISWSNGSSCPMMDGYTLSHLHIYTVSELITLSVLNPKRSSKDHILFDPMLLQEETFTINYLSQGSR